MAIPLLITIDTEGDDLWSNPQHVTTNNARYLPRFQELCERYGFKPTYLTNYEMAVDDGFMAFANDRQQAGQAEIGMHLHAWNSPPLEHDITGEDYKHATYLIDYPDEVLEAKMAFMTELLMEKTGRKPTSHRAGRWAMDGRYVKALAKHGYEVDCSVTPHVSWRGHKGDPSGQGGTDYRRFPELPYIMDAERMDHAGENGILQVPMTIMPRMLPWTDWLPAMAFQWGLPARVLQKLCPMDWFRPRRGNGAAMEKLLHKVKQQGRPYIEFMTHSSELMAAGSPYFKSESEIEALYKQLEAVFSASQTLGYVGMTLTEFGRHYREQAHG